MILDGQVETHSDWVRIARELQPPSQMSPSLFWDISAAFSLMPQQQTAIPIRAMSRR
jgi:hypothetical protein